MVCSNDAHWHGHEDETPDDCRCYLQPCGRAVLPSSHLVWVLQVRGLQGAAWSKEQGRFEEMAAASEQLVEAYLELASKQLEQGGAGRRGGVQELAAARMHLRGVLKQSEGSFGGTPQHERLQELLQRVQQAEMRL